MGRRTVPLALSLLAIGLAVSAAAFREVPVTQPNQVVEVAPGVYFRHGDLQGRGHCNNGIVVFRDFALVIDGNFPSGAEACLADVKKITNKPVRFVFDTHHHGDHAYGNPVWLKNGALPIAHQGVASEMARLEPARWRSINRPDVSALGLDAPLPPVITYPDRMVIDDGTQRVELLHFGTAHTRGDGFAYLPEHKVLFTGDVVVNGPYNFMGDGDTSSWIQVIDALKRLEVEVVGPGHGPMGDRDLLERQRKFILELRTRVAAALAAGTAPEELARAIKIPPELSAYVGEQFKDQVAKVHREMLGLEMPHELVRLGIEEGPSPTRGDPGWTAPRKVVLATRQDWLEDLARVAPSLEVVAPRDRASLLAEVVDADAVLGQLDAEMVGAARSLRWFQSFSAGVNQYLGAGESSPGIPGFAEGPVVLTNGRRCHGPNIADQVFAYLLAFSRKTKSSIEARAAFAAARKEGLWKAVDPADPEIELRSKTMLLIGAGGIGSEVARRAESFGMRVLAVDPKVRTAPRGVTELHPPANLMDLLPRADVVVVACPFTRETDRLLGKYQLDAMKRGAYLINVARGPIVEREALISALRSGKLGGAGLDVTDPEPLPDGDPLWTLPNVIITPHNAGQSDSSHRRVLILSRENLRRFAAGERLLNVVDKRAGY